MNPRESITFSQNYSTVCQSSVTDELDRIPTIHSMGASSPDKFYDVLYIEVAVWPGMTVMVSRNRCRPLTNHSPLVTEPTRYLEQSAQLCVPTIPYRESDHAYES